MKTIFALLAGLLALSPVTAALACSCRPLSSAAEHVGHADAIFRGRVVASVPDPAGPETFSITTFELLAPLKMPSQWALPPERIEVRHASLRTGPQCAIWYERGQEVLVAARMGQDGNLHTGSCDAPRWPETDYRVALRLAPEP
ncbi:MAG: hypothetical protein KF780_02630 [Sphingomonas sp.]|nr:hypothetical protein [Sphingomonas sp.]